MMAANLVKAGGGDLNDFSVSRSSAWRAATSNRIAVAKEAQDEFVPPPYRSQWKQSRERSSDGKWR